jgi:hypothetical protein
MVVSKQPSARPGKTAAKSKPPTTTHPITSRLLLPGALFIVACIAREGETNSSPDLPMLGQNDLCGPVNIVILAWEKKT